MLLIFLSTVLSVQKANAEESTDTNDASTAEVYDPDKDIVVKINDYEITYTNYQIAINSMMPSLAYHKNVSEKRMKHIRKTVLDSLVMDQLLYEEGLKRSIKTDKRAVKKAIRDFQKNLPKGMTLRKVLKQSNMTREDLANVFRRSLIINKIKLDRYETLMAKAKKLVTEKFMKEHYNKNLEKFREPGKIHLSEILLKADPGGGKRHWLEVRDQAKEVMARITGGADFAEVAKEVSEDPYAPKGGDMGWAHSGTLMEGLEEASANLKQGEVVGPMESLYGYHIIKFHDRSPSQLKPFKDLNLEKLKEDLTESKYKELKKKWSDALKEKAVIVYLDAN